jgi:hypothetical protein
VRRSGACPRVDRVDRRKGTGDGGGDRGAPSGDERIGSNVTLRVSDEAPSGNEGCKGATGELGVLSEVTDFIGVSGGEESDLSGSGKRSFDGVSPSEDDVGDESKEVASGGT